VSAAGRGNAPVEQRRHCPRADEVCDAGRGESGDIERQVSVILSVRPVRVSARSDGGESDHGGRRDERSNDISKWMHVYRHAKVSRAGSERALRAFSRRYPCMHYEFVSKGVYFIAGDNFRGVERCPARCARDVRAITSMS
jgi:hypothetical protein